MEKNIAILGSTGSIGRQALDVIDQVLGNYKITALAAGSNVSLLLEQINKYRPQYVSISNVEEANKLNSYAKEMGFKLFTGRKGLREIALLDNLDMILVAVSGINGLEPTLTALEKKIPVALANKETLVMAGHLVMKKARETGTMIIPVDSEHSAIFQCLEGKKYEAADRLILTASGGPFLNIPKEDMAQVTPAMALRHPKWQMGTKITIDSAGLINKGLEIIEAHWLFDMPYDKIDVVVHPQSIIHSMVQYKDGSILAQLGLPDMRLPIQYAFTYPERISNQFPKITDFHLIKELSFFSPDAKKFTGLKLAYEAGRAGGTMPAVYNGANEKSVELFLQERIRFTDIPVLIEKVMNKHENSAVENLEQLFRIDEWSRETAELFSQN